MNTTKSIIKKAILLFAIAILLSFTKKTHNVNPEPVAIVELFTSEGCSSCPAADKMLKEMINLTNNEGKHVIGLAFHVTYWNKLGWTDPFSQEKFTQRQKEYVQKFNLSSAYTPQMVFNGQVEFTGSNPIAFRNAVEDAYTHEARYDISATAKVQGNNIHIAYKLNKKAQNEILNVALIEHSVENHIPRGENKGLTLEHFNVVRSFDKTALEEDSNVEISLPEKLDPSDCSVVLYIQNSSSLKILGAAKVGLKK